MKKEYATFGAGCFWGVEEMFRVLPGVLNTTVGFMGGNVDDPSYEQVCTTETGHAEVVHIEFDPKIISYTELLDVFWEAHDPTQLNRQGADIGTQYRSVIFYYSAEQQKQATQSKKVLESSAQFFRLIVTQIVPAADFFKAEEHHQQYLAKRGKGSCVT